MVPHPEGGERTAATVIASETPRAGMTVRSVLIGALLIPLNAWWLAQIEYVR